MPRCLVPLLAFGCALMGGTRPVHGQTAPPPAVAAKAMPVAAVPHPDSVAAMLPYAKAFLAMNALRERADAEYADPKNKRPEVLAEARAKHRVERAGLLESQGFSSTTYAQLTQRVSGDDSARLAFEAALTRITAK